MRLASHCFHSCTGRARTPTNGGSRCTRPAPWPSGPCLGASRGSSRLFHPKTLDFRPETLFGLDLHLGLKDVNVGVDDAFIVCGDRRGQGVEIEVEVGVFGLPCFVRFAARREVEVPDYSSSPGPQLWRSKP